MNILRWNNVKNIQFTYLIIRIEYILSRNLQLKTLTKMYKIISHLSMHSIYEAKNLHGCNYEKFFL